MRSSDIRSNWGQKSYEYELGELIERVESPGRSTWLDIPVEAGIYVVYLPDSSTFDVGPSVGQAIYATPISVVDLRKKWDQINDQVQTDILYIGKGSNLRRRIRRLVRYGVGRTSKHDGGEWLWQVTGIRSARLLAKTCPSGGEATLEHDLLREFCNQHGDLPFANRKRGSSLA